MIFKSKVHSSDLYNTLLNLSRNIYFYKDLNFNDSFETRVHLMLFHFSLMMIIFKKKGKKFSQSSYDSFFNSIEYNLRELGFGDVSVNQKMKNLNKVLYDILLKIEKNNNKNFDIDEKTVFKYFQELQNQKGDKFHDFIRYLIKFYNFCFELPLDNMIREAINFKYNYGSS